MTAFNLQQAGTRAVQFAYSQDCGVFSSNIFEQVSEGAAFCAWSEREAQK
jgi:hypothetical protein